ncbi:MAG: major capsid protein [Microvirus sp.]|nr:MAG: major capsid protein [Microvirus sp.]
MSNIFSHTGGANPRLSKFNLSYDKKFTADMGLLYPILHDEVLPGDRWRIGNQIVIRFNPLVAPILHQIDVTTHYFYVPYRILWDKWEEFITGGVNGDYIGSPPVYVPSIPADPNNAGTAGTAEGTLWDYFGFPTDIANMPEATSTAFANNFVNDDNLPRAFPQLAYNLIFNEYYRDQNLTQTEIKPTNNKLLRRAWRKDYFTSALPFQQRGVSPAIPLTIAGSAQFPSFPNNLMHRAGKVEGLDNDGTTYLDTTTSNTSNGAGYYYLSPSSIARNDPPFNKTLVDNVALNQSLINHLNQNQLDFTESSTIDVAGFRVAFQLQRFLERNARAGVRYTEFLKAHFGVSPNDSRLQRPEYIGGTKSPVIISEIRQTSSTDTTSPQGNLAGHGISADSGHAGNYFAQEFGIIIGLMSITPKPAYSQGMPRQFMRMTRYDHYFPEFAQLSEQAVLSREIYYDKTAEDKEVFGFQPIYQELRYKPNLICGQMRTTLDYWHLGRNFISRPLLNTSFIECRPSKRILAVQSEPAFIVWFGNHISALRPMPKHAEPGYVDHF